MQRPDFYVLYKICLVSFYTIVSFLSMYVYLYLYVDVYFKILYFYASFVEISCIFLSLMHRKGKKNVRHFVYTKYTSIVLPETDMSLYTHTQSGFIYF